MMERSIERSIERETGGAVDIDIDPERGGGGTNVTFKGEDGESYEMNTNAGSNVELPDDWPKSVPLMNDARVTYAGTMAAAQGGGMTATYVTKSTAKEATDFYASELARNGWTVAMTSAMADGGMVTATKGLESVMVYVTGGEETTVVITLGVEG
jgi:hypothetical protein